MKSKILIWLAVGIGIGCFATSAIEGRYFYEKDGSQIVRINKFSGDPARLTNFGWEEIRKPVQSDSIVTPSTNHIWDVKSPDGKEVWFAGNLPPTERQLDEIFDKVKNNTK